MAPRSPDLGFPACCGYCPHRVPLTATCGHDLARALRRDLAEGGPCPVFVDEKTRAMRALLRSLGDG